MTTRAILVSATDELADKLQLNDRAWNEIPPIAAFNAAPQLADSSPRLLGGKVVAIARDAAFAFIYPANIHCLRMLGASIYRVGSLTASYFHAYFPSSPRAIAAVLGADVERCPR